MFECDRAESKVMAWIFQIRSPLPEVFAPSSRIDNPTNFSKDRWPDCGTSAGNGVPDRLSDPRRMTA